jgi:hypothetical protein
MNEELSALFQADRAERVDQPRPGTPEYTAMRERDHQRRIRTAAFIAKGEALPRSICPCDGSKRYPVRFGA